MRKQMMYLMFCSALVLVSAASFVAAQNPTPSAGDSTTTGGRERPSPEQVMQVLGNKLQLSDAQKASITPIIADRQQQLKDLQTDTSMRRHKKARKMKSILEESDKKINALLTPAQQKEYAEVKQQLRQQMQERRQNKSSQ